MDFVVCPRCRNNIPAGYANTGELFPCGGCGGMVLLDTFPAASRRPAGEGSAAAAEGAATCFFHDERPAQAVCDGCGRYVCALCDVPVGQEHLCPECLAVRNRRGRKQSLPNDRVVWDRFALYLAVFPLILWPFTIVTAPATLFIVIRYWRAPGSLVGRAWPRFLIAGLLALGQTIAWIAGLVALVSAA